MLYYYWHGLFLLAEVQYNTHVIRNNAYVSGALIRKPQLLINGGRYPCVTQSVIECQPSSQYYYDGFIDDCDGRRKQIYWPYIFHSSISITI